MSHRLAYLLLIGATILQTNLVLAQGIPPEGRFEAAPKIGEIIPDLTLIDDQGNLTRVRDVARGHYTVMTLGCLT